MPQECIRLSVFLTASGLSTRSPVMGQRPPLARVAAMTLALSHVTSMEHSWRSTHNRKRLEFSKWEQRSGKKLVWKLLFQEIQPKAEFKLRALAAVGQLAHKDR